MRANYALSLIRVSHLSGFHCNTNLDENTNELTNPVENASIFGELIEEEQHNVCIGGGRFPRCLPNSGTLSHEKRHTSDVIGLDRVIQRSQPVVTSLIQLAPVVQK